MNDPQRIVVDASAVVAALVDAGDDGQWVREQLRDATFDAPDLMYYESMNILRRGIASGNLPGRIADEAFAELWEWPVTAWPLAPFTHRVWELRGGVTAYDASYVALAEHLDAPLLTLDARLARSSGPRCVFHFRQSDSEP